MAATSQIHGEVSGLDIEVDESEPIAEADETVEEFLARRVIERLRTGHNKAALAAAADLTNRIASKHGLNGGAWL